MNILITTTKITGLKISVRSMKNRADHSAVKLNAFGQDHVICTLVYL